MNLSHICNNVSEQTVRYQTTDMQYDTLKIVIITRYE
jgi:hypothetical protein